MMAEYDTIVRAVIVGMIPTDIILFAQIIMLALRHAQRRRMFYGR
jgi:hypothetical protein